MREIQLSIDRTPRNEYESHQSRNIVNSFRFPSSLIGLQSFNKKLIDFERLLISNDQLPGMNSPDKIFK